MDPVKVVIFVVAFLLLLFLGRKLSSHGDSIPVPAPISTDGPIEEDEKRARQPAVIGAELPFPMKLRKPLVLTRSTIGAAYASSAKTIQSQRGTSAKA